MGDCRGSVRRCCFFDGMGSTSELTNESGTELGTYTYDAWGNPLSAPNVTNPFRFIGKYGYYSGAADGMYLLQQRYYRQTTGRFWTRDPMGDDDGANSYWYVHNRPTMLSDPSGLSPGTEFHRCYDYNIGRGCSPREACNFCRVWAHSGVT